MKTKVYIDGSEGTTGLRINERFADRDDIEILKIDSELRKDPDERRKFINASDITFLCLPDAAAIEAVSLIDKDNDHTVIIDASTAHRTEAGWAYGLPELGKEFRDNIKTSNRIANPGCYASGFLMDVYPLIELPEPHGDLIDRDALRKVHAEAEKGRYGGVYLVGDNRFMRRFEDAPAVIRKEGSDDIKCSEKKDS